MMANRLIAKKSVVTTYNVLVDIKGQINVRLQAASLEAALDLARGMRTHEFLEASDGVWNDHEHEVVGLWK
jgi:hypothetical protein